MNKETDEETNKHTKIYRISDNHSHLKGPH